MSRFVARIIINGNGESIADAAALAAVNDVPTSPTLASSAASGYVTQNYPGATATETYPTTTQIKVVASNTTPGFFGQIFGITQADVSATAVAGQPPDNFTISGNGISVGSASTGNGLSIYETGTSPSAIVGNNVDANMIFAPQAEFQISGNPSNNVMTGFIEAYDVTINGNNHQINGTGPPSTGFTGALQG
jgi:Putative Tad-like Flp pilus-assembly